ncbi:c-type cytochrome [uncultured Albimonas sp.]|uniref:c-type cytochrome n=1 Tax=uncultured Albimonas sp. TaxID=1331701 RepID=UPI0030ECD221|tara:strand:- start:3164 stop:3532 length:369 start_codon:yes stop_codon:yes gene_type:complete
MILRAPALALALAAATNLPALADGDASRGQAEFKRCAACHATDATPRVGPGLGGIVGRPVGTAAGFRYSKALAQLGGDWSPDRLEAFLADPRGYAPGTRMTLRIAKPEDRADLVAYLATLRR